MTCDDVTRLLSEPTLEAKKPGHTISKPKGSKVRKRERESD